MRHQAGTCGLTGDNSGKSGWQNDGWFLTAEGERLTTEI
jgi:hypothetical protein